MYMGCDVVHTPINCTSLRCRNLCIILASCKKASTDIDPSFNVFTATSTEPLHRPMQIKQKYNLDHNHPVSRAEMILSGYCHTI